MSEKIQIKSGQEDGHTAKEAMKQVVEYMKTNSVHAIQIITIKDSKGFESESVLFVKMFMRFLHRNHGRVFLLAENENMISKLEEYVREKYANIMIVETAVMSEQGVSDDMILNQINGAPAECIIAALSASVQDRFVEQYRTSLDAKIWFGIGTQLKPKKPKWNLFERFRKTKK